MMKETESRLAELRRLIDEADAAYHGGREVTTEDARYDAWKDELAALAPDDPRLTQVGIAVPELAGQKKRHVIPMGSLSKATNNDQFMKWVTSVGAPMQTLHASYKMDGGSFSFEFRDGQLVEALSRGDGLEGEDITANARKFSGLPARPQRQGRPFTGFVRAEVILATDDWKEQVDPDQLSNPRNYAAGIARRKNGFQCELLQVYAFRIFAPSGQPLCATETEQVKVLAELGFNAVPHCTGTPEQIWKWYLKTQSERSSLPYWIDGIVIKVDDVGRQLSLGEAGQRPKGQIAVKFEAEGALSHVREVSVSVGHTGAIAPTATLDPVQIGGTTVASATLSNWDNIRRLNIGIGDEVRVIKAGDIIPRILEVVTKAPNSGSIPEPKCCPACAGEVRRRSNVTGDESSTLYCFNPDCAGKLSRKIDRFLTSLDILGIGETLLEALVRGLGIADAADLYLLKERRAQLAALKLNGGVRLGEKRADRFLAEIEKRRHLTLSQFLGSLGILGLGKRRVRLIQEAVPGEFDTLNDWLSDKLARLAIPAGVPNVGKRMQMDLVAQKALVEKFLAAGVELLAEQKMSVKAPGAFRICITGALSHPKSYFEKLIREKGHDYTDTFNREVTHLVAADPDSGSSKLQKARKLNIPVIAEAKLISLLGK
jgi:DNA ligase (NAD+)